MYQSKNNIQNPKKIVPTESVIEFQEWAKQEDSIASEDKFCFVDDASVLLEFRRGTWIQDELVDHCHNCGYCFGFFVRKHHCRCCGKIFCGQCTSQTAVIPTSIYISKNIVEVEERVCSCCYHKIKDFRELSQKYFILSSLPLNIKELSVIASVNKCWKKCFYFYQNLLWNSIHKQTASPVDLSILWNNRFLLSGHSNWVVYLSTQQHLLFTGEKEKQLLQIINDDKRHLSCEHLHCGPDCRRQISVDHLFKILESCKNGKISTSILDYIWKRLETVDRFQFICYIPLFVRFLRYKHIRPSLEPFLLRHIQSCFEITYFVFWELTVAIEAHPKHSYLEDIRQKLVEKQTESRRHLLQRTFYFVENFVEISRQAYQGKTEECTLQMRGYLETLRSTGEIPLCIPTHPNLYIADIVEDGIRVKGSSSKPLFIPFLVYGNQEDNSRIKSYPLLYKKEDVRKDAVVMNIIRFIDFTLKEEEGLDLHIVTYNVLPTSTTSGFIEMVTEAETIYSINARHRFSILNFILEHNQSLSVEQVRDRFTKSCVAYCILSYLLGIGDRHLENIMIRHTGEIFHVDFGFILGYDPKPLAPEIRITSEMIDAMGGYESKHYRYFKELCARSFLCIRRHVETFRLLLSSIPEIDPTITKSYIENFITKKFLIGENINLVKLHLIHKVTSSNSSYTANLIDFCHKPGTSTVLSSLSQGASGLMGYMGLGTVKKIWSG